MANEIVKPKFLRDEVLEECLEYLDFIRETGVTNMFGAAPYLTEEFEGLTDDQASRVLFYWMKTFGDRHPE